MKDVLSVKEMFLDPMHVHKNLAPRLCGICNRFISLYEKALYAPSAVEVESVKLKL